MLVSNYHVYRVGFQPPGSAVLSYFAQVFSERCLDAGLISALCSRHTSSMYRNLRDSWWRIHEENIEQDWGQEWTEPIIITVNKCNLKVKLKIKQN